MSAVEVVPDMVIDPYTEKRSKQSTAFVELNVHDQAQFRLIVAETIWPADTFGKQDTFGAC
jgi:hypothetical protein